MELTLNSISFPFDERIITTTIQNAISGGTYEGKEARQLEKIIEPHERILEIGAGLGYMSALASRNSLVEEQLLVEANPMLIPYIKSLHAKNDVKGIKILNGILTNEKESEYDFYVRNDFWSSSLAPDPNNFVKKIKVKGFSFSKIINDFKPTLIICDIEGGEFDLFKHANLNGVQKVFVEIHQKVLGREKILKLFNFFAAREFHYDEHHSNGGVILFSHIERGMMRKELIKQKKHEKKNQKVSSEIKHEKVKEVRTEQKSQEKLI